MDEIYLREITKTDVPRINHWRQDKSLCDHFGDTFRFVNLETDENWFEQYCQVRDRNIRLAICLKKKDIHIGNVYLLSIDHTAKSAEFHIFLGETQYHGKGFGEQATRLCLRHGFEDRNLHRIFLTVLPQNKAAIAIYQKCGFLKEGTFREAVFKNGRYYDLEIMAILQHEWQKNDHPR